MAEQVTAKHRDDTREFVCVSLIRFLDGTAESMTLHRGPRADCERVADMTPAVSYSGSKAVKGAEIIICPREQWLAVEAKAGMSQQQRRNGETTDQGT